MKQKLIAKAQELRQHGFTTGEIADELKSFLNAVVNEEEPEITGEDGLKALKMVIAANKSSKEHRPVSLDELK